MSSTCAHQLPAQQQMLRVHQLTNTSFENELAAFEKRMQDHTLTGGKRSASSADPRKDKVAAPAGPRPARRRRARTSAPVPRRVELSSGWSDLLDEIASSSRRVRVAKGGHFGEKATAAIAAHEEQLEGNDASSADPDAGVATEDNAAQSLPEEGRPRAPVDDGQLICWRSYRIDDSKVPDNVLATYWRRAVDPKHCQEEVVPLQKVPRMTVTRREVEQLPPVHDFQHWRQVKKKRREARKAHEESEHFPPLTEMMRLIFGQEQPPKQRIASLHQQMKSLVDAEKRRSTAVSWFKRNLIKEVAKGIGGNHEGSDQSDDIGATMAVAREIVQEQEDEEDAFRTNKEPFVGVLRKGRRGAFDEGQPGSRAHAPLAEIEEEKQKTRFTSSRVSRCLEDSRSADHSDESCRKLAAASRKVNEHCQRKVTRMHTQFLRKQGQLSTRLQRRVQRLQMDFQETQDTKVGSILPSVVVCEASAPSSVTPRSSSAGVGGASNDRGETVLHYLQHHRHRAERQRQSHHAIYLQQVERFQGYLRLLADPNRSPERGELYLSECFRHVLSAGLIIDTTYFIRTLCNLDAEDFEKTPTVNLLAACCVAFNIDLREYWAHLQERGLAYLTPQPQTNEARSWEDWAPWNGVRLEQLLPQPGGVGRDGTGSPLVQDAGADGLDDSLIMMEDPLPFGPIVPEETPGASELVSREDDPLLRILQQISMDSVLERYKISRTSTQPPAKMLQIDDDDEEVTIRTGTASSSSMQEVAPQFRIAPRTPQTPPKDRVPTKPATPPTGTGPRSATMRAGVRKAAGATLQRTRGIAEPISEMPGAPDKDRPRAGAQAPSMAAIAERPMLE